MANPNPSKTNGLKYADAGVDIDAGNVFVEAIKPVVKSTARPGSDTDIGGFGGLFDLAATHFKDPILVAANDGVGTKLRIAIEADIHDTVGIDLVAMCVNDLVVQGAEPLFFLDYLATAKLEVEAASAVVSGIAEGCRQSGAALIGGETAEMPGMYHGKDYDLAGFAVGAVERDGILPRRDMQERDVILGLASSGLHSNGFSLVRKVVDLAGLNWNDAAPFETDKTVAQALLEPTKIYVKPLLAAIRETGAVKGMAHITGGGFTENIPRVLPTGIGAVLDLANVTPPPVFGWVARTGGIAGEEMLRTFNCGIGMVVIVPAEQAEVVTAILTENGETVTEIGTLTSQNPGEVTYTGEIKWG